MAPPAWLPPLNSHHDYTLRVHAFQYNVDISMDLTLITEPTFLINLTVTVDFHGKQLIHDEVIPGLNLETGVKIPSTINPPTLAAALQQAVINDDFVPFLLNRCTWKENRFRNDRICPRWEQLEDEEELLERLSGYLLYLKDKPENKNRRLLPVRLEIRKVVAVEEEEFGSWVFWFREQKRVDPDFEENYRYAIGRPRSDVVLSGGDKCAVMEGLESVFYDGEEEKKACSICLEGILSGSRIIRLPCLHVYHADCVLRWLRSSCVCPLCRYELPAWE